jgi:hypothetical protein
MLEFTNVYFFESGLFNGLRAIQIQKRALLPSGCIPDLSRPRFGDHLDIIRPTSVFGNEMSVYSEMTPPLQKLT